MLEVRAARTVKSGRNLAGARIREISEVRVKTCDRMREHRTNDVNLADPGNQPVKPKPRLDQGIYGAIRAYRRGTYCYVSGKADRRSGADLDIREIG